MSPSATPQHHLRELRHLQLEPASAQQLLQLRQLRRRRAESAWAQAAQALAEAQEAVQQRQRRIEQRRRERQQLQEDLGGALAPQLPRWSAQAGARQAQLDEWLEREEYALLDDEHALERAQDTLRARQQELARLQEREDLAQALLHAQRQQGLARQEKRRELALEERRPCA